MYNKRRRIKSQRSPDTVPTLLLQHEPITGEKTLCNTFARIQSQITTLFKHTFACVKHKYNPAEPAGAHFKSLHNWIQKYIYFKYHIYY